MKTWLEEIVDAFSALGRHATYDELYNSIETRTKKRLTPAWQAGVRAIIERHSSDSTAAKKPNYADLFKKHGKGTWGLRAHTTGTPNRFELIQSIAEIAKCQRQFRLAFCKNTERHRAKPGYPGGDTHSPMWLYWNDKTGIYGGFKALSKRYWNIFGDHLNPLPSNTPTIVQINPAFDGHRQAQGAFVRDRQSGTTFLAHRGGLGGYDKGTTIWKHYRGDVVNVFVNGLAERLAIVTALDDEDLQQRVADFVFMAREAHADSDEQADREILVPREFSDEYSGSKEYRRTGYVNFICRHGLIVNRLAAILKAEHFAVSNDVNRDVTIKAQQGRMRALFEVKPSSDSQSVYTGVGQLMMNGKASNKDVYLVLVAPKIGPKRRQNLRALGIHFLSVEFEGETPRFTDLSDLFKRLREQ